MIPSLSTPLSTVAELLQRNPVEAVESAAMQQLMQKDPGFYKPWDADERWRLIYGLAISLLDYAELMDLSSETLLLPGGLPSVSLWQLCDSLVCVDFALDGLDWCDELELQRSMRLAELEACTAVLSSPETLARLDVLIAKGLGFIEQCEEYPTQPCDTPIVPNGLLWRLWRRLPGIKG
jgi:hypothetical protein